MYFVLFKEFYLFYLNEYRDSICCMFYFIGLWLVFGVIVLVVFMVSWLLLWFILVVGYGFVWVGYFFFEKNCFVIFKYLFYSLMGDWVMFKDIFVGKISFKGE